MSRSAAIRGAVLAAAAASAAAGQPTSVVYGPHNLSAGSTGPVRAVMEDQVCIFCHTPHRATPVKPLWNRIMPMEAYTIYKSNSLDALPGQPTGTSKMCLSCHDGTIALGSVVSRDMPIQMAGGVTTMPAGEALLGTDLSDDHPISFRYDSGLAGKDPKIRQPSLLPSEIILDANSELQCTSCHDAHNNSNGKFLVMRNDQSQLCASCHQVGTTAVTGHQQCSACHQPHTAPSGPYLLRRATVTETCATCHNGSVAGAANIDSDMHKSWTHDTGSPVDPPGEMAEHTTCSSCHDPHTMQAGAGRAPAVHANFGRISGMNASGSITTVASYEFEVCFKCHGLNSKIQPTVTRQITPTSMLAQFSPSAVSSHPVEAPGHNNQVPSLKPGWTTSSVMYCSDCHGSDSGSKGGGAGPNGTHGSHNAPLLVARYDTSDYSSESASTYALCYTCHDRNSILSESSSFKYHRKHVVEQRSPCSACHDAHGIASGQGTATRNSNLINFATAIVLPDPKTGRLEFRDTGMFRGECYLSCHGKAHSPLKYPD